MMLRRRLAALHGRDEPAGGALMPMIDVVFLLMIFFLFGRVPLGEQQILARLAETPAGHTGESATMRHWVTLRRDEAGHLAYRLNGGPWWSDSSQLVDMLSAALQSPRASGEVAIDSEAGVSYQDIIDTFALVEHAGATQATLVAQ